MIIKALSISFLIFVTSVASAELFYVNPIEYTNDARVLSVVKQNCHIPQSLMRALFTSAAVKKVRLTENLPNNQHGKVLTVKIVQAIFSNGANWVGGKGLMLEGELHQDGRLIASFSGIRGNYGNYYEKIIERNCDNFVRSELGDGRGLGEDIVIWLRKPILNAFVGEGFPY